MTFDCDGRGMLAFSLLDLIGGRRRCDTSCPLVEMVRPVLDDEPGDRFSVE
jgi:hypothetical protein